ncbi:HTTM domain-containing protein [Aeromicrobium chenweiae]|uniref:HTTM-like domain-containing protein n=1 Tax=Aeromicrobium chenweiae TaxID=2079793 RepID=A0A2S0WK77_9ACTN|nr:HTTM domain-containing protein [Aeromicrobium chenweiae]AWB91743.1 hypothetical protein C3E78_05710 [Aeromicrobium chenweiae]TGN32585.1 hypothetical protein E4L97_07670 [Aeromicrobium chenweiae]
MLELGQRAVQAPLRAGDAAASWLLAAPRALYGAAACRMGTALSVLGLLATNFSSRDVWVGQGSIWAEPARALSQFPELALLDGVSGDVLTLFYVITMAAAVAMVVGWHTKAANVVTLVGFIAVVSQNPVVGDEGDNLVRITLMWLLLMQTAERWSLDARRRERRAARADGSASAMREAWDGEKVLPPWLSAGLHHVGLIGLGTQTVLLFMAGGLDKISQDIWQRGTALYSTMQLPEFRPYPRLSDAVSTSTVALAVLTYTVLLTQLFFGPLLLHRVTRRVVITATVLVNVVLAVLLALPWSSLAFLALAALFVSTETYERLDEWLRDRLAPVGDWLVLRWYDVQDAGAAVLDRTWWPVADWFRASVLRR